MIYAILAFIGFHLLNIFLGWWNVKIVKSRIARGVKKQIEHGWWSVGYLLVCLTMNFFFHSRLVLAFMILHLSVFPVAYNRFRDLKAFYLSTTSEALTDRMMVKVGLKNMALVCGLAEVVALALFVFSLYKL